MFLCDITLRKRIRFWLGGFRQSSSRAFCKRLSNYAVDEDAQLQL